MANYTVVETSKLLAVHGGEHMYSLISDVDVENGSIGYVGDIVDGEGSELHDFGVFDASTINKKRVVIVANPEWSYEETRITDQALYNYINEAEKPFRAYGIASSGDNVALSVEGFDAEPTVGDYVTNVAGSTKFSVVGTTEPTGQGFIGKVIGVFQRGLGWTVKNGTTYGHPYVMYMVNIVRNDIID